MKRIRLTWQNKIHQAEFLASLRAGFDLSRPAFLLFGWDIISASVSNEKKSIFPFSQIQFASRYLLAGISCYFPPISLRLSESLESFR